MLTALLDPPVLGKDGQLDVEPILDALTMHNVSSDVPF